MTHVVLLAAALALPVGNAAAIPYTFTNIVDTSGPFVFFSAVFPSLNNSGAVAFNAILDTGVQGIFTGSGGPITTIVDTSRPLNGINSKPSLNNSGTVAFNAFLNNTGAPGIFTSSGGPITTIAHGSGPYDLLGSSLNNSGTVAFRGILDTGQNSIFTGSGGPTTTIVDISGPFLSVGLPPPKGASCANACR